MASRRASRRRVRRGDDEIERLFEFRTTVHIVAPAGAPGYADPIDPRTLLDRLPQLAGTRLDGTFHVAEATVNELLRLGPAPLSGCLVELAAGNRVVVRYGPFQATAAIAAYEPGPSPRLRLALGSFVVALGLRAAVRQPYVRVSGREVVIDLAAIPALQPYAAFWPILRRVAVETTPGRARVDVEIVVAE
jgi:hypothetical protein